MIRKLDEIAQSEPEDKATTSENKKLKVALTTFKFRLDNQE